MGTQSHETELIIKGNPQWPQAFYPTTREFNLTKGDEILTRCTYSSLGKSTFTYAGEINFQLQWVHFLIKMMTSFF
jgi:peptidylamidoglycolate lyase